MKGGPRNLWWLETCWVEKQVVVSFGNCGDERRTASILRVQYRLGLVSQPRHVEALVTTHIKLIDHYQFGHC